jgi:dTMP kinase
MIRDILQHDKAGEPITAETEVLLFAASRAQLVRHVIIPALERGVHVVCDRFADSTTAYQGFGRGFPVDQMLAINAFAISGAEPDLTLLLDLDVRRGMERLAERNVRAQATHDRIEREEIAFHERVRAGYLDLAQRWPDRFHLIDADTSSDAVSQAVWQKVGDVIGC